jgi:hypothetical protein
MIFDGEGNLYIADFSANAIGKVSLDGKVSWLVGWLVSQSDYVGVPLSITISVLQNSSIRYPKEERQTCHSSKGHSLTPNQKNKKKTQEELTINTQM